MDHPGRDRSRLRVLFIEDNPQDFRLCEIELGRAGMEVDSDLVSTKAQFLDKLRASTYDIIVSDYHLPGWTGMDALKMLQNEARDIPVILLTGVLGDDRAVECVKSGIADYILKDRLSRLPVALVRAVEEKRVREERRQAEHFLRRNEAKFRTLAETIPAVILIYEEEVCRYANQAAQQITGFQQDELLSKGFTELLHPESFNVLGQKSLATIPSEGDSRRHEIRIIRGDGEARWLSVTAQNSEFEGRPAHLVTGIDITDRRQMEQEIQRLVLIDPLTGLGNYRQLVGVFGEEAGRCRRTGRTFALVFLDLDDLKKLNDTHGHLAGSRALCRVAEAIRFRCRSIDTAARYGGDEFAIVLPETGSEGARNVAGWIAEHVRNVAEDPPISVSYGVAVYPDDGATIEEVFRKADRALYSMKGVDGRRGNSYTAQSQ